MMREKALAAIARHGMITPGDNVIVALSGGADSVALFRFLLAEKQTLGIAALGAAHFEHGLRGAESLRDAAHVKRLCDEAGVPLATGHGRMNTLEKPKGEGTEAWARRLRYAFLDGLAAEKNAKVATAHTRDDNAETVLFRAVRGTGPKGLGGIPPVRGSYIRPLIDVTRAEILAYCAANGLSYVVDSTNAQPCYARNRLRAEALPLLEDIRPGAGACLAAMAADMRELGQWLDDLAWDLLQRALVEGYDSRWAPDGGADAYLADTLLAAPQPVRMQAYSLLAGPAAGREALRDMQQVAVGEKREATLAGGVIVRRYRQWLTLERGRPAPPARMGESFGEGLFEWPGGYALDVKAARPGAGGESLAKNEKKGLTFAGDYDKIFQYSVFRARCPGDFFRPAGRGVTKPLKKWMHEAGVPPARRAGLPLLAEGGRVLWVWGAGFCEDVQPDESTRRLALIRMLKRTVRQHEGK